jgi:hypothetical protein
VFVDVVVSLSSSRGRDWSALPTKEDTEVIDVSRISSRGYTKTQEWVRILKGIPKGKALVYHNQSSGKYVTVRFIVKTYTEKGLIPHGYRVRRHKTGDTFDVYIIHDEGIGKETE